MDGEIEFDPRKNAENQRKHRLSLQRFPTFDEDPYVEVDDRYDYGEVRFRAIGRIAGKGYSVVFTIRDGNVRLISFRRAHDEEKRKYGR